MIERCGDRQRKRDGLKKWRLHSFVESLPLMLQVSLFLLACGLCRYMWSINASVAYTLIGLTGVGAVFYVAIVIAGTSSYACPFQTPVSIALHGPWKKVRRAMSSYACPFQAPVSTALRDLWKKVRRSVVHSNRVLSWTNRIWNWGVRSFPRRQSLPTTNPFENIRVHEPKPWLEPKDLVIICRTNASDVGCVSWILRYITDPEAIDAALPLAGEIRWFDDEVNVNPPYDQIVSTFEACFDPTGTLYPESRDRAYYSRRAMMWIHTLASRRSWEFAKAFPLPHGEYKTLIPDPDLEHLLQVNLTTWDIGSCVEQLLRISPGHTPQHLQWISNLLLHCSYSWTGWIKQNHRYTLDCVSRIHETKTAIPLNVTLNHLLLWCTFLGSPVEEEVLKVQAKSYDISCFYFSGYSLLIISDHMVPILDRLSKAVLSAVNGTPTQQGFIPHILRDLIKLKTRPMCLTKIAYEWCSAIYKNRESHEDWAGLLLVCLEIGFRHLDFQRQHIEIEIAHTENHRGFVDAVFEGQESEVIADLLHAWTAGSDFHEPAHELLGFCTGHLVDLQNLVPFPSRLRRLVIRSVEVIGCKGFEGVGVEKFVELLDHLHVTAEDMDDGFKWATLLVDTIERTHHLSHWYWELLVELVPSASRGLKLDFAHGLQTIAFLTEAEEWDKLECWMGVVWMVSPWKANAMAEGELGHSMLLLFRQRPGAVQKLEQWMGRWDRRRGSSIPESFKRICEQAHEAAQ